MLLFAVAFTLGFDKVRIRYFSYVKIIKSKHRSKLFLIVEFACPRDFAGLFRAVLELMPYRSTAKAAAAFFIHSFFVVRTLASDVAFFATIEAVRERILCLSAFLMRVILRSTFVAEAYFDGGAICEEMFSGATFEAAFLMSFFVLFIADSFFLLG